MKLTRRSPSRRRPVTHAGIVLASASPRRARILESLGVRFKVVTADIDERIAADEDGARAAVRLATAKAVAVARGTRAAVLGADTVVLAKGHVLGKPRSARHAAVMLRALAGREHEVVTGVCIVAHGKAFAGCERTRVRFAGLSPADVRWYVATGEPMDKAGAYHIDGLGALFVTAIVGSPSNVEGLPVGLVRRLARRAGVPLGPDGSQRPRASRSASARGRPARRMRD